MKKQKHQYRSWVEVDLSNFAHNWRVIKNTAGKAVDILQVVKADAYGHGAIEISNAAIKNGATMLGVANADEGAQIRISGITAPILILSPSYATEIPSIIKHSLIPSVSDVCFANDLQKFSAKTKIQQRIHIEVDTGMGRGGIIYDEALPIIKKISKLKNLFVEGVFTHLAISEQKDAHNDLQWHRFHKLLNELESTGIHIPIKHMANSGGLLNFPDFQLNMVRPGLMSFGVYPDSSLKNIVELRQVMSFKTHIVLLKEFPANYSIGYGKTFVTKKRTTIATIPVGYADGFSRFLSNSNSALVGGIRCPIVGRISMDMCTIDVSAVEDCAVGDEVVLLGCQQNEFISADEMAQKTQTISYEVLCALGKRAPRIFVSKGKTNAVEPRLKRIFVADEEKSIKRIDDIIRHCLQARTKDEELGNAIYYEMFETLFGKHDRPLELRTNMHYQIVMEKFSKREVTKDNRLDAFFKTSIHVEYTKELLATSFMIGCAKDNKQLESLFQDTKCEYRWLLDEQKETITPEDFHLLAVRIDGQDVTIEQGKNTNRGYEICCSGEHLKSKLHKQVKMEFEIVTRKPKDAKMFSVFLVYPTRGAQIIFNYEKAGIKRLREVSFFAGKTPYPKIMRTEGKQTEVSVSDNEWIFPNSGVTFFWE